MNDAALVALLFRIGEHLLAVEALTVQAAHLRADPAVTTVGTKVFLRRQKREIAVQSLAPFVGEAALASDWAAIIVLGDGSGEELALSVGRCEVVCPIRNVGSIARRTLLRAASPATHIFKATLRAREELGVLLSTEHLLRSTETHKP
jgi:hypothetical protein